MRSLPCRVQQEQSRLSMRRIGRTLHELPLAEARALSWGVRFGGPWQTELPSALL